MRNILARIGLCASAPHGVLARTLRRLRRRQSRLYLIALRLSDGSKLMIAANDIVRMRGRNGPIEVLSPYGIREIRIEDVVAIELRSRLFGRRSR